MGFFGGAMKALVGGSDSKQSSNSSSGFGLLPQSIQQSYTGYADQLNNMFKNQAAPTANADQLAALESYRQGFAPTSESLQSDISMLSNPFDEYVVNGINRESQGQNSLVNQQATMAGQQGSNRSFLGTSDVEQNRLNNIGTFKQGNYNNALNAALTTLPSLRQSDAANLMNVGQFQQDLPYANLTKYGQLLGVLPTDGGSTSTSSGKSSSSNGLASLWGGGGGGGIG